MCLPIYAKAKSRSMHRLLQVFAIRVRVCIEDTFSHGEAQLGVQYVFFFFFFNTGVLSK